MLRLNRTRVLFSLTALVAVLSLAAKETQAFPPFVAREGKPCAYCHVNAQGGGKRNYRGIYYKAHNLAFVEFDDAAEAKKAGVEIGPEATPNPKSYTPPKGADTPGNKGSETPAKTDEAPSKGGDEVKALSTKEAAARVKVTEADYKKAPKNAAKKKAYGVALADLAHATMLDQAIAPRTRYPAALKLTRDALKLDPTNKTALEDKKSIEDAYKSMGRPIPK